MSRVEQTSKENRKQILIQIIFTLIETYLHFQQVFLVFHLHKKKSMLFNLSVAFLFLCSMLFLNITEKGKFAL